MKLKKNIKILATTICLLTVVGVNAKDASAERLTYVNNTVVNNLRVRSNPSTNSAILKTLENGKDLVYGWSPVTNESKRSWTNYAYPDSSVGKYSKSVKGWVCTWEDGSTYVTGTTRTTFHSGSWVYNDKAMTKKHKYISPGQYLIDSGMNRTIRHDPDNLNLWSARTHDDNAQVGDYPKTRYFNGWMANAIK